MLSPEQREAAIAYLVSMVGPLEKNRRTYRAEALKAAATALTNEPALAEQVRGLREALEAVEVDVPEVFDYIAFEDVHQKPNPRYEQLRAALAAPLPEAVKVAGEMREKAELLEWIFERFNEVSHRIPEALGICGDEFLQKQDDDSGIDWLGATRAAKQGADRG